MSRPPVPGRGATDSITIITKKEEEALWRLRDG